jgi:hypothetical protein
MHNENHRENPELWFRPSPVLPLQALSEFIDIEMLRATPRLGKRDGGHPKGYIPGTRATLRLFDALGQERLVRPVLITDVISRPLRDLTASHLRNILYSTDWRVVLNHLSFLEGRLIDPSEVVSVVEFSYRKESEP